MISHELDIQFTLRTYSVCLNFEKGPFLDKPYIAYPLPQQYQRRQPGSG